MRNAILEVNTYFYDKKRGYFKSYKGESFSKIYLLLVMVKVLLENKL